MSPSTASRATSHTRPNPPGLPLALWFALSALLALGCSSRAADVTTIDAGSPCTSDRQCSARGGVCDRDRGVCVACRTGADCLTAGTACIAQQCVTVTPCTTSRVCPGQVCNTTLGYCVDCNADGDCTSTQRCQNNSCVARPRVCTSSRQCSDLALVCDTAQSLCVECVADGDCDAATQFCAAGGRCAARVCAPSSARCTAAGGREVCNARGTSYDAAPCSATQSCRDGSCVDRACVPGTRRCPAGSAATYETCNADGLGYTATPCPGGQSCAGGACVMQNCTPGARRCAGPTGVQTCNADGLGFGATTACPAGNGCNAMTNTCGPYTCSPGAALGCAGASARVVCSADGQSTATVACVAGQSCSGGLCMAGSTGSLVQRSCAAAGTPGCGMVTFAGGTFTQGEATTALNASPVQTSTVGNFALDAYEVTVARFNAFWAARSTTAAPAVLRASPIAYPGGQSIAWGAAAQAPLPLDAYNNWSATDVTVAAHPMNGVDYWLAQEFCVWEGGRLPTEAEWEYAARGSASGGMAPGRVYPWGDADPVGSSSAACDRAQFNFCTVDDGRITRRVGSFAATAGLYDMAGNVFEWTADNYGTYPSCRVSSINSLCGNSSTGDRVCRGGSWSSGQTSVRAASRYYNAPAYRNANLGFRCARDTP